jgi:hypothetical protein
MIFSWMSGMSVVSGATETQIGFEMGVAMEAVL